MVETGEVSYWREGVRILWKGTGIGPWCIAECLDEESAQRGLDALLEQERRKRECQCDHEGCCGK